MVGPASKRITRTLFTIVVELCAGQDGIANRETAGEGAAKDEIPSRRNGTVTSCEQWSDIFASLLPEDKPHAVKGCFGGGEQNYAGCVEGERRRETARSAQERFNPTLDQLNYPFPSHASKPHVQHTTNGECTGAWPLWLGVRLGALQNDTAPSKMTRHRAMEQ